MSQINITNLTFAYDGSYTNVFENVSFSIDTNYKLGFTGRNGRGKTTFLNLLLGKYEYKGNISAQVNFEYFPYEVANKDYLTKDVILEICIESKLWQMKKELNILEVKEDVLYRPFDTLSKGEQTKVLLCALFLKQNAFLLIDEPTNHLDVLGRETVSNYLNTKNGFLLVSHDRDFLDKCTNYTLSINKTNIEITKGSFSTWFYNKSMKDNFEIQANEKLKGEIKRLNEAAKRTAVWSDKSEKTKYNSKEQFGNIRPDRGYIGAKSAKVMQKSKNLEHRREKAISQKQGLLKNIETFEELKLSFLNYHGEKLIEFNKVALHYDDKIVCKNVSFAINKADRVVIKGCNGSGKSSVLKLITGENINYKGDFYKGGGLIISYVPQSAVLKGDLKKYAEKEAIDESLFKAILRKLDFARENFDTPMEKFSMGQQKKVLLAKSLCQKAHLYVWDEPLNYIDVFSRMQIENLILQYAPTLVFVEHDIAFCNNIAKKTVELEQKSAYENG